MLTRSLISLAAAALIGVPATAQTPADATTSVRWTIDPAHSSVGFAVKHMGIATVRGHFAEVAGIVETEGPGLTVRRIAATINPASIATGVARRDTHLRSPDFFDVAQYPEMGFESTRIEPLEAGRYAVEGLLTMRGQAHPVTLTLETAGAVVPDPWGNRRTAGTATGTLNRKDWGLTWNQALELGGLLVGDQVTLTLEVEAVAEGTAASK